MGDGPAGLALAAAARRRGVDVVVVGTGQPWAPTYGTWRDDVPDVPDACFATIAPAVVVHGHRRHVVERPYAIVDDAALRAHLAAQVGGDLAGDIVVAWAERYHHDDRGTRVETTAGPVDARLAVDATGGGRGRAAQTAYGIVLDGVADDLPTLMDLRPAGAGPPTFAYRVPVADGWLVEETVLAARPPVPADDLAPRLAARLGGTLPAGRVERVTIPLAGALPDRHDPVVRFGAAAGYAHPATGYSVATSLRAASRVADAIVTALRAGRGRADPRPVHAAIWPRSQRATRRLHRYGLAVLLRLDQAELATFFDAFFDLPVATWAPYLRVDAPPTAVMRTMTAVLRRLPRGLRRRMLVDPRGGGC